MRTKVLKNTAADYFMPAATDGLFQMPFGSPLHKGMFSSLENSMSETADSYTLEIPVPGMKKKDLTLELTAGVLTVQGFRLQEEESGWTGKTKAISSTHLYRTFALPEDADAESIRAKCRDGLLTISIPKVKSQRTSWVIPIAPIGEVEEMKWRQKLASAFRRLKHKIRRIMSRIGIGSKHHRISVS